MYANNQWKVDLGAKLIDSPFFGALRGATRTLVMMDRNATILSRLWWCRHDTPPTSDGDAF